MTRPWGSIDRLPAREVRFGVTPETLTELTEWAHRVGRSWDDRLQRLRSSFDAEPD